MEYEEILSDPPSAGPDDILVLDLRRPDDFKEFHVKGVANVPFDTHFIERLSYLGCDKRRPIYLLANSSQEARQAELELLHAGFTTIRRVVGGCEACSRAGIECVEHSNSKFGPCVSLLSVKAIISAVTILFGVASGKVEMFLLALIASVATMVCPARDQDEEAEVRERD